MMSNLSSTIPELSVIMPALNEEGNISFAVENPLKAFDDFGIRGEIIVINDGSADGTETMVRSIMDRDERVRLVVHKTPRGVGASFWDGVDQAKASAIVMLPGDNENDPWEIFRYFRLLEHVDIVIPFVFNRQVRPLWRNALSYLYRLIVNTTFFVNFNYTNGTILFRKSVLQELDYRSSGFFFLTDILIRLTKQGYLFAEVPYRVGMRREGLSKAVSFPSFRNVVRGYFRLVRDFHFNRRLHEAEAYPEDSMTAKRRKKATDQKEKGVAK